MRAPIYMYTYTLHTYVYTCTWNPIRDAPGSASAGNDWERAAILRHWRAGTGRSRKIVSDCNSPVVVWESEIQKGVREREGTGLSRRTWLLAHLFYCCSRHFIFLRAVTATRARAKLDETTCTRGIENFSLFCTAQKKCRDGRKETDGHTYSEKEAFVIRARG